MFSKRFVYRPNHFGNFELSGPAILHNEIAENYRKDEINELIKDKDLRLEFRKSDKGIWSLNQYGYCKEEVFFDLNNCKVLSLEAVTKERIKKINLKEFQFPELLKEKHSYTITEHPIYAHSKVLGKIAFKNRIKFQLEGRHLQESYKERIDNAVNTMKWFKETHPEKFADTNLILNKK